MRDDDKYKTGRLSRGTTLNGLKDQLYSLNMQMLLAVQSHNESGQEKIRAQMAELQEEIDRMASGGGRRIEP